MFKLNVNELLHFFDEAPSDSAYDATAIVSILGEDLGVALLQKRLDEDGIVTHVHLRPDGHPLTPATKGCKLDRWLMSDDSENPRQYQVEIKNWSAHALYGRRFSTAKGAPEYEDRLREHRIDRWKCTFNGTTQSFWNNTANKVLIKMVNPPRPEIIVEPLICFWNPMHHEGEPESLFRVDLKPNSSGFDYDHLWVFSMSNYLRSLAKPQICLEMPAAAQRIQWLGRLVTQDCQPAQ